MSDLDPPSHRDKVLLRRTLLAAAIVLGAVLVAGTLSRLDARERLHERQRDSLLPVVTVVHPAAAGPSRLVLPGRLQAWNQALVYARANGYLRRWHADIGDSVQAGQLLAEIDTPEIDQQLSAARAALATAQAQLELSRSTNERWKRLLADEAVSKQDADERSGDYAARLAMRNEATANLARLQAVSAFQRVVAPFAGVITSRAADIGALVVADSTSARPLFTVADVSHLRLYVSVPEAEAAPLRRGQIAHFTVADQPHRAFDATLVQWSGAVDPASGAVLAQFSFDNHDGRLKAGAYAQVTFDVGGADRADAGIARVPATSLILGGDGPAVALVDRTGVIRILPVTVRTDFGTTLAVSGVTPDDWVVDNPPDDIEAGDKVEPKAAATSAAPTAKGGHA